MKKIYVVAIMVMLLMFCCSCGDKSSETDLKLDTYYIGSFEEEIGASVVKFYDDGSLEMVESDGLEVVAHYNGTYTVEENALKITISGIEGEFNSVILNEGTQIDIDGEIFEETTAEDLREDTVNAFSH